MVKENKRQRSRLIQLIIVFSIIAIIAISFGVNVLGAKSHEGVPKTLLEMKLGNYIDGATALNQVSQLHGTGIELTGAIVASYSHDFNPYHKNDDRADVWIGKTKSSVAATDLLDRMIKGIQTGKGNTPFSNVQKISVEGYEVYQVDGPGSSYYFYAVRDTNPRVIWLTINSANPSAVLRESINVF